jgi:hypothetical protein
MREVNIIIVPLSHEREERVCTKFDNQRLLAALWLEEAPEARPERRALRVYQI